MDTFITVIVLAVLCWAGYFGFQLVIGKQLNTPRSVTATAHPAAVVQRALGVAGKRGWTVATAGDAVVVTHVATKATIRIVVGAQGTHTSIVGTIAGVAHGSTLGIRTNRSALSLLRRRDEIIGALASPTGA